MNENDSLHILPLANIPLQIPALRQTRLIKTVKLEGMVELYSGTTTGSGQVTPEGLADFFDFSGDRANDLTVVKKLADLPSYDVYSLRTSLAKVGIEVDDVEALKLSDDMADSLATQMSTFTRPLVAKIYGDETQAAHSLEDIAKLFSDGRSDQALKNLSQLAERLEIALADMPQFLEDYADVYLSLAYFQKFHEDNATRYEAFMRDLEGLARAPSLKNNPTAAGQFEAAVETFRNLYFGVGKILVALRARAVVMWEDISARRFRKTTDLVIEHQEKIGAMLCAITVKLNAWRRYASAAATDSAADKANFVNSSMMYGLDELAELKFQET